MLYLESFVHRVQLAEVVSRWMVNKPRPEDAHKLKEIVNFNSYISRLWADHLASWLLQQLYGEAPRSLLCKNKGQLKDFIVRTPRYTNPRIEELFRAYREFPEDYYRESPFDGRAYYAALPDGTPLYVGSTRICLLYTSPRGLR